MPVPVPARRRLTGWAALVAVVSLLVSLAPLPAAVPEAGAATAIEAKYAALGGSGGRLGPKVGNETCGLVRGGCYQKYQAGHIHWSPASGTHATWGGIGQKWGALSWERGFLGYPVSDETCGLLSGGCYQTFQGGSVHWTSATGAHFSRGTIRTSWAGTNWERGPLRYPTSDEVCGSAGCWQTFQGGRIDWTRNSGIAVATNARLGTNTPVHSTAWRRCTPTLAGHVVDVAASQRTVTIVDQTSKTGALLSTLTRTNSACGFIRVVYAPGARLGWGGTVWYESRVQDTGTTPRGSFLMTESFGNGSAPSTEMPYRVTTNDDYWVLDRKAATSIFNEPRRGAQGGFDRNESEHLRSFTTQYRHSVVIDFNRKSNGKVPSRGGGIFLHVHGSGATAGCVSVTLAELEIVLRYLKPGDKIVITT